MNPAATERFRTATLCRRFEGQVAMVTGGARGLGRVIAKRLAEEGCTVVVADLDESRGRATAQALSAETGREVICETGDVSEAGVADAIAARIHDRYGRFDVLVNNAAALMRMRLSDFTEELMQLGIRANVWTTLRCCRAAVPYMARRSYGRIVNIGGEAWRSGVPFHTILAGVGKGSMVGLTVTLAGEVAETGITVNCLSPGAIESSADGSSNPPAEINPAWTPPDVLAQLTSKSALERIPMRRMAHPTEMAAAVAFFASPEASYITGQHLGISGGMVML